MMDRVKAFLAGSESVSSVNENTQGFSVNATKKELLNILSQEELDWGKIHALLEQGTFKGKEGKDLRNLLSRYLYNSENKDFFIYLQDFVDQYTELALKEGDADDQEAAPIIHDIVSESIQHFRHKGEPAENVVDFLSQSYPYMIQKLLSSFDKEENWEKSKLKQLQDLRLTFAESLVEDYPFVSKSLLYSFTAKKYSHQMRVAFEQVASDSLEDEFNFALKEIVENVGDQGEHVVINQLFDFIFDVLGQLYMKFDQLYSRFWQEDIDSKMKENHERRFSEKESSLAKKEKKSDTMAIKSFNVRDRLLPTPSQREMIRTSIDTFLLGEKEKKEMIKKISRLVKNGKPFKVSDYLGENGFISVKDEGKLMDLIEDLGIAILEETVESAPEEHGVVGSDFSSFSKEKTPSEFAEVEKFDFDLEQSEEQLVEGIIGWMEGFGYTIGNRKKLFKQIADALKFGSDKKSLVSALTNPEVMNKRTLKNGQIYAISLNMQNRLILIKNGSGWEIDSFHSDHDAYEDRIDAIK